MGHDDHKLNVSHTDTYSPNGLETYSLLTIKVSTTLRLNTRFHMVIFLHQSCIKHYD